MTRKIEENPSMSYHQAAKLHKDIAALNQNNLIPKGVMAKIIFMGLIVLAVLGICFVITAWVATGVWLTMYINNNIGQGWAMFSALFLVLFTFAMIHVITVLAND